MKSRPLPCATLRSWPKSIPMARSSLEDVARRDHCIGARPAPDPARPSCSSPNSGGLGGAAASPPRAGVVHLRPRQLAGQSIPAIPQSGFGARAHVRRLHGGRSAGRPWRVLRDRIQANSASAHAEGGRPFAGSLAEIRTSRSFKCGRCSRPAACRGEADNFGRDREFEYADLAGQAGKHAFRESGFHPSGQSPRASFSGSCASGTIRHGRF
jgi:hypothetical protein